MELVSDGGFAYTPARSRLVRFDTSRISPDDLRRLEGLLSQAHFFTRPAQLPRAQGAADDRQYTISVTSANQSHSVTFYDSSGDEALLELAAYIHGLSSKYSDRGAA